MTALHSDELMHVRASQASPAECNSLNQDSGTVRTVQHGKHPQRKGEDSRMGLYKQGARVVAMSTQQGGGRGEARKAGCKL